MSDRPIEDLVARLERERRDADRRYNAALTAVDRALQAVPRLPAAPSFDATRLADVNEAWNILPAGPPPMDRSVAGRIRGLVWRLVGPPLEQQVRFNAALVDHANRDRARAEQAIETLRTLTDVVTRELTALAGFESLLVQFLQTITAYVDTKDRSLGGVELRERLALTEQRLMALKRAIEGSTARDGAAPVMREAHGGDRPRGGDQSFDGSTDGLTYVGFEDRFRGTSDEILRRVEDYLPLLRGVSGVLDVGCGRGELLHALAGAGVSARGIDLNPAMVDLCRSRGLQAEASDALSYLERVPDASVGGLVAIQVVEHFSPAYLGRFLQTAYHKMRIGAPLVLETINPACWMAFFETYLRDLTHRQPLHPETLQYVVQASGFSRVGVQFRQPVSEQDRLERVAIAPSHGGDPDLVRVAEAVNAHADKLNARLFSAMDYVVTATR